MKINLPILLCVTLATALPAMGSADELTPHTTSSELPNATTSQPELPDTLADGHFDEAVVVASPKETATFRQQPISASVFDATALQLTGAAAIKDLAAFAPNFFIPHYGSRLTSAAYIRGVGSRIGTPAVGLYVDNVPVIDKSAYDFAFMDVTRVDVLRGPQSTLYGRNAMGGIVRVFTADPFTHDGLDVSLSASGRGGERSAKAVLYLHPSDRFALSIGGFNEGQKGYFRNSTTGDRADGSEAGGGKIRLAWRPTDDLRLDLTASYEYSDEDACPYYLTQAGGVTATDALVGQLSQNRPSSYRRELLTTGLNLAWTQPKFVLSSVTAYQYLRDRLFMDQDFVATDIFSLEQRQRIGTISEELSMKSRPGSRWQWTTGLFFMYQGLTTTCPVTSYGDGVSYLNSQFASVLPTQPAMSLSFNSTSLPFDARFKTPTTNAALFHQSSFDLGAGLSLIAGLRLDYDHTQLSLSSYADGAMNYTFSMPSYRINFTADADPSFTGSLHHDTWQLLPKLALQYNHRSGRGNVYIAVSKGYRGGGYNIQSYSELAQTALRRVMMLGVKDYSLSTIDAMPMPDAVKEKAKAGVTSMLDPQIPSAPNVETLSYAPEQSWNYELGGHLKFFRSRLLVEYTLFYMHTKDQQIARFSTNGYGRTMVNAGKSRSLGAEITLRTTFFDDRLRLNASYGFTDARFTDYELGAQTSANASTTSSDDATTTETAATDYNDNRVPFAPAHTMSFTAAFRQPLASSVLTALSAEANIKGAGSIYWDEANTFSEPFYATLDLRLAAEFGSTATLGLWAHNLTATHYTTFAFESMQNRFAQYGTPRTFGLDLALHF